MFSSRNDRDPYYTSDESDTEEEFFDAVCDDDLEINAIPNESQTVIVFMDVDSFDVQVRGRNEGISPTLLKEEPYVVVNDHNVITAVNYPAKQFGVKRTKECTLEVAMDLCPTINVLTIPEHYGKPDALGPRKASDEIYDSLERSVMKWCKVRPPPKIEKASKDEFYIDVSDEVFYRVYKKGLAVPTVEEVASLEERRCFVEAPAYQFAGEDLRYRNFQVLMDNEFKEDNHATEALLMHGAAIADSVLKDIHRDTGFIVSAGVSSNKLLAKLGCGYNKPDAITVLPRASIGRVSKKIKIADIPGLGGKLGKELTDKLGIETMYQLSRMKMETLIDVIKNEQVWKFHQMALGHDSSKVVAKKFCNTLTCGITFNYATRRMYTRANFFEHLKNRFLEMREHLYYDCRRNGFHRIPKSVRLEIKTRKHDLKAVFGATVELDQNLRNRIAMEAMAPTEDPNLPVEWQKLFWYFINRVKEDCKIDLLNENYEIACAAVRKISEINLIATFKQLDDEHS